MRVETKLLLLLGVKVLQECGRLVREGGEDTCLT